MNRSGRLDTFKQKGATANLDRRALKMHRRSIEWKNLRSEQLNRRRNLDMSNPSGSSNSLEPVDESEDTEEEAIEIDEVAKVAEPVSKKEESMKEKLRRWREEKELKRKVAALQNKKAVFKVSRMDSKEYKMEKLQPLPKATRQSSRLAQKPVAKPNIAARPAAKVPNRAANPPMIAATSTKRVANPPKNAPTSAKRAVNPPKTVATSTTRVVNPPKTSTMSTKRPATSTSAAQPPKKNVPSRGKSGVTSAPPPPASRTTRNTAKSQAPSKVTTTRGTRKDAVSKKEDSFAPSGFVFTAPTSLPQYTFKPLSPGAMDNFFGGISSPALTSFSKGRSRCSTPRSAMRERVRVLRSPSASDVAESATDSAESQEDEPPKLRSSRKSVSREPKGTSSATPKSSKKSQAAGTPNVPLPSTVVATATPKSSKKKSTIESAMEVEPKVMPMTPRSEVKGSHSVSFNLPGSDSMGRPRTGGRRRSSSAPSFSSAEALLNIGRKTPKQLRNSLILRTLSPEESVEVLMRSPMVEMKRRRSKVLSPEMPKVDPMPDFNDVDLDGPIPVEVDSKANKEKMPISEPMSQPPVVSMETQSSEEVPHDVPYFRQLIITETDRLNDWCSKWEAINSPAADIPEGARGEIRTTIGKAQLLISQRFKQFRGLIDNCEFNTGDKPIGCSDLQGFWDMVYYQVEDIDEMFKVLDQLQANSWEKEQPKVAAVKVVPKVKADKQKKKPKAKAATSRPNFRTFMAQKKKEQAAAAKPTVEEPTVEIVMAAPPKPETKTFQGEFFSVSSPVVSPKPHCNVQSPATTRPQRKTPKTSPFLQAVLEDSIKKTRRRSQAILSTPVTRDRSPLAPHSANKMVQNDASPALKSNPAPSIFTPETPRSPKTSRRSCRKSVPAAVPTTSDTYFELLLQPSKFYGNSSPSVVSTPQHTVFDSLESAPSLFTPDEPKHQKATPKSSRRTRRSMLAPVNSAAESDANSGGGLEMLLQPSKFHENSPAVSSPARKTRRSTLYPLDSAAATQKENQATLADNFAQLSTNSPRILRPGRVSDLLYSPLRSRRRSQRIMEQDALPEVTEGSDLIKFTP